MANWDDIRVFLAVARAGSLSRAAPGLRMDPATLSRRISRLEESLSRALFMKTPQGYELTEAGQALRAQAEAAEDALAPGLAPAPMGAGLSGHVRIGAPDGCANFLLPQVCAEISAAHPALELQVLALPRVVNLSRREADLAITVSAPQAGRLTVRKITDYRLHFATRREAASAIRTRDDLRDAPIVGYVPDMIFDRELDYLGDVPKVHLASNSVAVQLQTLRHRGYGIVHDFALPFAPELRRILTHELSLTRSFYLVRHAADRRSTRLAQISDALISGLRAQVARLEAEAEASDQRA